MDNRTGEEHEINAIKSLPQNAAGSEGEPVVTITPQYEFDSFETTIMVRGLREGAHIVISVPGVEEEQFLLIGKRGKVHSFGFGKNSGKGPVRIGP